MPDKILRIGIWCAVSSADQAEDGKVSLPEQEHAGREFAASLHGAVVRVYCVPGHTREYLDFPDAARDMDAYRQLEEDCQNRAFDVLWVRGRDRLGRTLSLIAAAEGRVQRAGAEVYSAAMPHQIGRSTGDANNLMAALESWQAQREMAELRRRVSSGIRGRVSRGLAGARWPYGYTPIRNALGRSIGAEFNDNINAVRLATDMFLRGEPYRAIQKALNASPWKPHRASRWTRTRVQQLLARDTYAGIVRWGELSTSEPSTAFPALWDQETFRAIQAERQARRKHAQRRGESSPLTGVAFCQRCGRPMNRFSYTGPRCQRGLRCATHTRAEDIGERCHWNQIVESKVVSFVHDYLARLVDPQRFTEALAAHKPAADLSQQIADAERRVKEIEEKRTRLGLGFASGVVKAEVYQAADAQLEDDLTRAMGYLAELVRQRASRPSREEWATSLRAVLDRLDMLFEQPTAEIAATLRRIGLRVWIENGRIVRVEFV